VKEGGGYRETESGIEWCRRTNEAVVWLALSGSWAPCTDNCRHHTSANGDDWFFLSGTDALGAAGIAIDIDVALPEQLTRFASPQIDERTLADDVACSFGLRAVAPDHATVPLLGAIYRAVIGGSDMSVHINGFTGAQKTELATVAQQHFCANHACAGHCQRLGLDDGFGGQGRGLRL
jgi:hypothetical protein